MSKGRRLARAWLPILLTAASSCAYEFTERMPANPERRSEPLVTVPVVVTPARDLRPDVLKEYHDPVRARLMTGFWVFGYHYAYAYDGPLLYGDSHIHLTSSTGPKEGLPPMAALDAYLPQVLGASIGSDLKVAAVSSAPDALRDPARLLPEGRGFVIVPVVDQMDVCKLSSETFREHSTTTDFKVERRWNWDTPAGRRWSDPGPVVGVGPGSPMGRYTHLEMQTTTETVTSGGRSNSGPIGNVRVRLMLFRVDGGRVVARSIVYAAGVGNGLAPAMVMAGMRMARGVGEFVTQPGTSGNPSSSGSGP